MKVIPAAQAPAAPKPTTNYRAAAIEAFNQGAKAQPTPVPNPSNISPEELSAITSQVQREEPQESEQTHIVEETTEAAAPETTEPAKPDPLSSQYAILARKEKALRAKAQQQEQAFKAREEALKAKEASLTSQAPDLSQYVSKDQLKRNALQALADAGVSYDEITQQQINAGAVNPAVQAHIDRLEARLAKQEAELEDSRKGYAEQQDNAYKAAVAQIQADATKLVNSDPTFETIKATRSVKDVVELIELTYKEDGTLLSVEEAAQQVEDHLLTEIDKLMKIEKIKKRSNVQPAAAQTAQKQPPTPQKQPQGMKTLTNATSTSRTLSAKERAILAFKGELSKG